MGYTLRKVIYLTRSDEEVKMDIMVREPKGGFNEKL